MNDAMGQLRAIGASDPAVQARLMEDMQRTDPAQWPMLLHSYRASLAYRDRAAGHTPTAQDAPAPGFANRGPQMPANSPPSGVAASPPAPSARISAEKTPWAVLQRPIETATVVAVKDPRQPTPGEAPSTALREPARLAVPLSSDPIATVSYQETILGSPPRSPAATIDRTSFRATAATTPAVDSEAALAAAIRAFEGETREPVKDSADVSRHAYLRMLYLAAGRRDDALRPIAGLASAEQDYWSKQLATVATWLDSERIPDAAHRAAEANCRLAEAAARLSHLSALVVRNMAFCTEVSSYGVYTRFKDNQFAPGQQVLLYAEVENFKSVETTKGHHTALESSYRIVDRGGRQVAVEEPQLMEEYCQNPRHDYFVRYRLHMPKPLTNGRYTLQLSIDDTLAHKVGSSSIEFEIVNR
ncbi:MAG: hypothetical protein HYX69_13495 [Planctomycetia bacterium]|nr:hypothetical protein [Planctomycetia bacterium]